MRPKLSLTEHIRVNQQYLQFLLMKIFIVTLFLPYRLSNLALIFMFIFWIVSGDYRNFPQAVRKKKILMLFIAFYLIHIVGLLYSDNLFAAYKELEKKIPLILFPIIIASIKDETLRLKRNELLAFYATVTGITCGLLVAYAIYRYTVEGNSEVFYFRELTALIEVNAIYFAMYVLFAFGVYFYELNTEKKIADLIKKMLVYAASLMVFIFISSKTALFVFILLSLHLVFLEFKHLSRIYRAAIGLVIILLIAALINYSSVTKERIQNLVQSDWTQVWDANYTKNAETFTGFTVRVSFWKAALEQMTEDKVLIQGIGTGDNLDYLNKAYQEAGLIAAGYTNFNLHNAFMEVVLEFGLAGLFFYLFMWITIAIVGIQAKDNALIILLIIFFFFSMTESILYVNKGLVFFSLWVSLLLNFININSGGHRSSATVH